MNHPSKGCPQTGRGEAAAEGLDAMTTAELTEGLEALCETMSEENYNGVLVGAYLDALDRKAPVPDAPSAEESHAAFLRRIGGLSGEGGGARSRRTPRRLFRGGLVAAVLVVCLFSGMVAAQAAGRQSSLTRCRAFLLFPHGVFPLLPLSGRLGRQSRRFSAGLRKRVC